MRSNLGYRTYMIRPDFIRSADAGHTLSEDTLHSVRSAWEIISATHPFAQYVTGLVVVEERVGFLTEGGVVLHMTENIDDAREIVIYTRNIYYEAVDQLLDFDEALCGMMTLAVGNIHPPLSEGAEL